MRKVSRKEEVRRMRIVINVEEALWEKVKHAAIDERKAVSHIVKDLLEKWLADRERRKEKV